MMQKIKFKKKLCLLFRRITSQSTLVLLILTVGLIILTIFTQRRYMEQVGKYDYIMLQNSSRYLHNTIELYQGNKDKELNTAISDLGIAALLHESSPLLHEFSSQMVKLAEFKDEGISDEEFQIMIQLEILYDKMFKEIDSHYSNSYGMATYKYLNSNNYQDEVLKEIKILLK